VPTNTDKFHRDIEDAVSGVRLADAAAVRRLGDRRTRRQVLGAGLAVAAVLAGAAFGLPAVRDGDRPQPGAPTTAPPTVTPTPPTPPPAPVPGEMPDIPDAAMLRAEDLGGGDPPPAESVFWPHLQPPKPCAGAPSASDRLRETQRAITDMTGSGETPERPTVFLEYVARYRPGGAAQYLAELRDAIGRCPGAVGNGNGRWTATNAKLGGDDSLLIRLTRNVPGLGGQTARQTVYVAVARLGNAVVVVADLGWEGGNGHEPRVRQLTTAALHRAEIIR
jgi:hypothetical protein